MNVFKGRFRNPFAERARRALALFSMLTLLSGAFVPGVRGEQQKQRLSEDQRIMHVLNRLGFGARPGDVERVRAMGLENYIREQLEPSKIADAVADAKVRELTTLSLSTSELYAKFPQPGMLLRQLERRGELPPELAALRDSRAKANGAATAGATASQAKPDGADGAMMRGTDGATTPPAQDEAARAADNQEYRRAIRDYMLKNGLQPPQRIVAELQASRILRAVYSERQLQEVMVDFWSNHFNVFAAKGADRWLLVSYDRDTIRPHTMGKFSELLRATAESPAMLFYLDNFQSVSPNAPTGRAGVGMRPQGGLRDLFGQLMRGQTRRGALNPNARRGQQPQPGVTTESTTTTTTAQQRPPQQQRQRRGINENYARELMELHTLGVDGGYTQKDVQEVARCFTGWTIFAPRGQRNAERNAEREPGQFYFNSRLHDDGEKTVLGHRIPAGGGVRDGLMVLDILAHHPSTAKFIAKKLARRFVMDEPTPQLIDRIAAAFTSSDGSIRETLRAIFASPEFNSPEAYRAKIKTPFELAVTSIRTLGGETNGGPGIHQWIARMGEPLYGYQAPTGYPDRAESWVNTGALLERLNFGLVLASNRIPGTRVDLSRFNTGEASASVDQAKMMDRFLTVIVQGEIPPKSKERLLKQLSAPVPPVQTIASAAMSDESEAMGQQPLRGRRRAGQGLARVDLASVSNPELVKVVGLILGSPEFQRQ